MYKPHQPFCNKSGSAYPLEHLENWPLIENVKVCLANSFFWCECENVSKYTALHCTDPTVTWSHGHSNKYHNSSVCMVDILPENPNMALRNQLIIDIIICFYSNRYQNGERKLQD